MNRFSTESQGNVLVGRCWVLLNVFLIVIIECECLNLPCVLKGTPLRFKHTTMC